MEVLLEAVALAGRQPSDEAVQQRPAFGVRGAAEAPHEAQPVERLQSATATVYKLIKAITYIYHTYVIRLI